MREAAGPSQFRPGSWDLGFALGLWLVFMVVMALGTSVVPGNGDEANPRILIAALPAQLMVILFVPWLLRLRTRTWRAELGFYQPTAPCILRGLVDYVWVAPLWWAFALLWMATVQSWAPDHHPSQEAMKLLQSLLTGPDALWLKLTALFVTTVGAAASEEILFRGLMQGALRRRMGKQLGALTLGAFFGIIHMQPNMIDSAFVVLPLALLGYLLCLIRERPGGLWACIVIHAANNGLAIYLELNW